MVMRTKGVGSRSGRIAVTLVAMSFATVTARAAEIGHFVGGLPSIRDFVVPEPGFYALMYNYGYSTERVNDVHGSEIDSVTIDPRGPLGPVTVDIDIDIDMYALAPALIWVSDWKILGAKYGAYILPTFANVSVGAALSTVTGSGRDVSSEGFDVGDMFVQPIWLGWTLKHFDFALGYGFYAPVGHYQTETVTLPVIGSLKVEDANNVGLGFWTNQLQGAATWYPFENKATAFAGALTYEIHEKKQQYDITAGQDLTLNWGISQYLPLMKSQALLLEIGPAGYSTWQVSDDRGSDARNPGARDAVHAIGGQLGLTYVPWGLVGNLHAFGEVDADDRFQGVAYGLNLAKKF